MELDSPIYWTTIVSRPREEQTTKYPARVAQKAANFRVRVEVDQEVGPLRKTLLTALEHQAVPERKGFTVYWETTLVNDHPIWKDTEPVQPVISDT